MMLASLARGGGTGIRAGFKNRWPQGRGGSTPPPGTKVFVRERFWSKGDSMHFILAFAILFQDKAGSEAYQKVASAIESAKTIRIKFKFTRDVDECRGSGTLLLKDGGKVKLAMTILQDDKEHEFTILSDGTKVRFITKSVEGEDTSLQLKVTEGPGYLRANFSAAILHLSLLDASMMANRPQQSPLIDFQKVVQAREFKLGDQAKEEGLIIYGGPMNLAGKGVFENTNNSYEVKLWCDPKSWIPRKREVAWKLGSKGVIVVEKYEEFVLNSEISDESFKMPEGK